MKKALLLPAFLLFSLASFSQNDAARQNLARQINTLFVSSVDSNTNQIINIDKLGTLNIMYKDKDENVDFNVLDVTNIELIDKGGGKPEIYISFTCAECMHLTSPSAEKRAAFETSLFDLPIKYKDVGLKLVSKLTALQKASK